MGGGYDKNDVDAVKRVWKITFILTPFDEDELRDQITELLRRS